jgi:hypothetical protein
MNPEKSKLEIEKAKLWQKLVLEKRKHRGSVIDRKQERGIPRTALEEIELIASLLQTNEDFKMLLNVVSVDQRRTAYEQLKSRLSFVAKPFHELYPLIIT